MVTFKVAPDYEAVHNGDHTYSFTAMATDTSGNSSTQSVTITILNVIEYRGFDYKEVVSPYTGKVWLDRNLGASRVCTALDDTACYGELYQWGRDADGHQERNSTTTSTLATDINATNANFITSGSDWVANGVDDNGSLRAANWSKTDGSSICPVGFRVPTIDELRAENVNNSISRQF